MLAKQFIKDQNMVGMGVHTCNPRIWEEEAERSEVKIVLSYTVNLRPAWAT